MRGLVAVLLFVCGCAGPERAATLRLPSEDDIVSVHVAVRAGSVDDPEGKEGLTHLALHLMREGGAGPFDDAARVRERYALGRPENVASFPSGSHMISASYSPCTSQWSTLVTR